MYNVGSSVALYKSAEKAVMGENGEDKTRFLIGKICKKSDGAYKFHKAIEVDGKVYFTKEKYHKDKVRKNAYVYKKLICDEIAYQLKNNNQKIKEILRSYLTEEGKLIISPTKTLPLTFIHQFFLELKIDRDDFRRIVLFLRMPGKSLIERLTTLFYQVKEKLESELREENMRNGVLLFCLIFIFYESIEGDNSPSVFLKSFSNFKDVDKVHLWFLEKLNLISTPSEIEEEIWSDRYKTMKSLLLQLVYPHNATGSFIKKYKDEVPITDLIHICIEYDKRIEEIKKSSISTLIDQMDQILDQAILAKINTHPIDLSLEDFCKESVVFSHNLKSILKITAANKLSIINDDGYNFLMKQLFFSLDDDEVDKLRQHIYENLVS